MEKIVGNYTVISEGGQVRIEGGDEEHSDIVLVKRSDGQVQITINEPKYSALKVVSKEALQAALEMLPK